jgi:DNA polymerase-3 subunit epsilon
MKVLLLAGLMLIIGLWFYRRRAVPPVRLPPHFVVVDIETTGLSAEADAIIEIAAIKVRLDEQSHYASHAALVDPGRSIPAEVTRLTGISTEMVQGRRGIDAEIAVFLDFVGDAPLVFYYADFDMRFLRKAAEAIGRTLPNRIIDVLPLAQWSFPRAPDHRLSTLAAFVGHPDTVAHRALHDCITTLRVIQYARAKERGAPKSSA